LNSNGQGPGNSWAALLIGNPRIENRSDVVRLVESLVQDVTHYHRKDYFLLYGLNALLEAMKRKII
jgi:hypothetical protein